MEKYKILEYNRDQLLWILPQDSLDSLTVKDIVKKICENRTINFEDVLNFHIENSKLYAPKLIIKTNENYEKN